MRHLTSLMKIFVVLVVVSLIFPPRVYAYLDPGTGSYILQLILAALLGAAFAIKIFWKRIKTFFADLLRGGSEEEESPEGSQDEDSQD